MRRREKKQPLMLLRRWKRNGEERFALHPLYLAIHEHYSLAQSPGARVERGLRLAQEIGSGERRAPEPLLERMLELDRSQRASGYPDENLEDLAQLLRRLGEPGQLDLDGHEAA